MSSLIVGTIAWGPVYVGPATQAAMPGVTYRATVTFTDPVTDVTREDPVPPEEEAIVTGLLEDTERDRRLVAEWDATLPEETDA